MSQKLFSYDPNNPKDDRLIEVARDLVRTINKAAKVKLRITQAATQVNPKYAWKYDNMHKPRLRLEDAKQIQVYLHVQQAAKGRGNRKKTRR